MRLGPIMARAALALLCAGYAAEATAQTSDDLFNDQTLQRIDLWVNSRDMYWLRANYLTNTYYTADFKWNGQTVRNVGIRSRGSGSRDQTKLGLRVDFNRYVTGQTFLGLKALVIDNLVQDPSCIREVVAMKAFRRMGLPAPRESFAALYINNAFAGLYALIEDIGEPATTRLFGESQGFLFEYKWTMYYYFDYLGSNLSAYAPLFQPVNHQSDPQATIYGPIEAMVRTINEAPDADFRGAVGEYLDLLVFMHHVGVQQFLADRDGILGAWGVNNFYFYRFQGKNLSQFIAWDADNAMAAVDYAILNGVDADVLMRRAMTVPELRDQFYASVNQTAVMADDPEDTGTPWLLREVTRLQDQIRATAYVDTWKPYTNAQFDQASAELQTFAQKRGAYVRCEVKRLTGGGGNCSALPGALGSPR